MSAKCRSRLEPAPGTYRHPEALGAKRRASKGDTRRQQRCDKSLLLQLPLPRGERVGVRGLRPGRPNPLTPALSPAGRGRSARSLPWTTSPASRRRSAPRTSTRATIGGARCRRSAPWRSISRSGSITGGCTAIGSAASSRRWRNPSSARCWSSTSTTSATSPRPRSANGSATSSAAGRCSPAPVPIRSCGISARPPCTTSSTRRGSSRRTARPA